MEKKLYIYENWSSEKPELLGTLYINNDKGKDVYAFEYDKEWLKNNPAIKIDPDIELWPGRQYCKPGKPIFGFLSDSCPDTWGRQLMKDKELKQAKKDERIPKKFTEYDYLIRVDDKTRMGAIRISREINGRFISDNPISHIRNIRELEKAAIDFDSNTKRSNATSLDQLLSPASSLGGAWPKASVQDTDGSLWIAKFPSKHDNTNREAWEMVCHDLAKKCDINVPEAKLQNYSKYGSTYLSKRFDRNIEQRIHFSSAMNLLGKIDGDDSTGYIDIVSFIKASGAKPKEDLIELYKRMVFNMCIKNSDDHLRNHGFLLTKKGWILSPAYDLNPTPYGNQLKLFITESSKEITEENAISVCKYFGIAEKQAKHILNNIAETVNSNWKKFAKQYKLTERQITEMELAFKFYDTIRK